MEDYNSTRGHSNLNSSFELIKPILVNDRKMNFQELKDEYSRAISYIDHLRTDKNNLIETIKLLSNKKPSHGSLTPSSSKSQLRGTILPETEKKIVQLEQENRELKKTVSGFKNSRGQIANDKKVIALEQENLELRKTLEMKTDQIMALQKEAFAQDDLSEIERLDKQNRQLKKEVDYLNQYVEKMTQKYQEKEDEENLQNSKQQEANQEIMKYINYILNTITTFQPGNPMRDCFEERFSSAMEVHRLINSKDYIALLMKCLKFISDILMTSDIKTTNSKPSSKRNLNVQELLVSNVLDNQNAQLSSQKRKSLATNRPNTPLGRSSGSGTLNTSIATNCQTPSNISTQDKRASSVIKGHRRTPSQEITNSNNTESHIIYGGHSKAQPHHAKNISLVPESQLVMKDNNPILDDRRGSKTSRNDDRIAVGELLRENIISPKVGYSSIEKDRRSKSNIGTRIPQTTPLETSLNERFLNEREQPQLRTLNEDLQERRERIRNLSREVERLENKESEILSSYHVAGGTSAERKGHKRVNTDSCISVKDLENDTREEKSVIRLKPVLKASTYNREREYEKEYESNPNPVKYQKSAENTTRSGFGGGYLNPYATAKDQLNELNRKFQNLEMSGRGLSVDRGDSRGKSPLRAYRADPRADMNTANELSDNKYEQFNEYERPRRREKEEIDSQRYTEEEVYQPKVLPRPQPKDRLEEIEGAPISNMLTRNKTQSTANIGNPYTELAQNRVTFEMRDNIEEDGLADRKSSSRNIGSFRSPVNANLKSRGGSYASFQVSFGRTESKDRISPSPQEKRSKSPSIMDVPSRKKIDHVDQTYDIIRGQEMKNK